MFLIIAKYKKKGEKVIIERLKYWRAEVSYKQHHHHFLRFETFISSPFEKNGEILQFIDSAKPARYHTFYRILA